MARISRKWTVNEGLAVHKVWRGHNREWNLKEADEKGAYAHMLNQEFERQKVLNAWNAASFMSNHSHEVYELEDLFEFSKFMRRHHGRYGIFFNTKHERRGKVAQDRPFTSSIEADDYEEMRVVFYIHANPVRARIVKDAKDYRWSTHRLYAFGRREKWMKNITFPKWYLNLGKTAEERRKKYRKLFDAYLRGEGLIKRVFSAYGIGRSLWVANRREEILGILRKQRENLNSQAPP